MFEKQKIKTAVEECLKSKGEKKFTQSVDLAVNFRDIDFKKPENKVNLDVILPFAPRPAKVAIFADGPLAFEAKKVADLVLGTADIDILSKDKKKQKELLEYSFLASTQLMAAVGKSLGQVLGAKGKLPKPILPGTNLGELVERTKRSVSLKTKGKNLPVVHCIVGNEKMSVDEITENINAIVEALVKKIPEQQIKSLVVKTTMGKPVKMAG